MFAHGMGPVYLRLLLQGLILTLELCAVSLTVAILLSAVLGVARARGRRLVALPIQIYVEAVRSIPLLLLLFLVYYSFPILFGLNLGPFWAGVVTMGMYQGAFMTQVVRAGVEAIPSGQWDAAASLRLNFVQTLVHVVAPQAMRVILPAAVGQLVSAIKDSSLASIIGLFELTRTALAIRNITLSNWDVLSVLTLTYVVVNSIVAAFGVQLERHFNPSEKERAALAKVLDEISLRQI